MLESDLIATRMGSLLAAFKAAASAGAKTALAPHLEFAQACRQKLELAAGRLDNRSTPEAIADAGKTVAEQIGQIRSSNEAVLQQRDAAVKEVVTMVAGAVRGFKGNGEAHTSRFTKLADEFDSLSRIEDPAELLRQLHVGANKLRKSAEEMLRNNETSVRQFESQLSAIQQRLDVARKGSATDPLTGLGSRLDASRYLGSVASTRGLCFQLFDIEAFAKINQRHGTLFGDRLLKALADLLRTELGGEVGLFRWGGDEFLVIAEGPLQLRDAQCGRIQRSFSQDRYLTVIDGLKSTLTADVAYGVAEHNPGEGIEETYRRARESLEQNRVRMQR
jgi:diguanylate cyclase